MVGYSFQTYTNCYCYKITKSGQPLTIEYHAALHLEIGFVMCVGADENQAHCCDPYGLKVQEEPLFLVCSSITIFTSVGLGP